MDENNTPHAHLIVELARLRRQLADLEDYRALVESALQGVAVFRKGHIVLANAAFVKLSGYTLDALLALTTDEFIAMIHPEDRQRIIAAMEQPEGEKAAPPRQTFRLVRRDGEIRWVEMEANSVQYRGEPAWHTVYTDITGRVQAEAALRESEHKFRSVVQQLADGIVLADEQGRVIEWNRALESITGIPASEMLGRPIWDVQLALQPPEDRTPEMLDAIKSMQQRALRTGELVRAGEVVDREYDHPDGTRRHLQGSIFIIQTGRGFMLGSLTRDITDQHEADHRIRDQLQWNQLVLDTTFDGYILTDAEGQIRQVNASYCALSGYTADELTRMNIRDVEVRLSDAEVEARITQMVQRGHARFETTHRARDGHLIELDVSSAVIHKDGEPLVAAFVHDITERKRAAEALRHQTEILEAVLKHIPVMITFRDPHGRRVWTNRYYQQTLHVSATEAQAPDMLARLYPDPAYRQKVLDFVAAANGTWDDFKTHALDGHVLDTSWANVRLQDGSDIGIGLDITERKRMEEDRQRLLEQIQHYAAELEQRVADRTRELSALYDIASVANQNLDLHTTLTTMLQRALDAMDCKMGALYLSDGDPLSPDAPAHTPGIEAVVQVGFPADVVVGEEHIPSGSGLVGTVLQDGEPIVVPDIKKEPRANARGMPPDLASAYAFVPIHTRGQVSGVLSIGRSASESQFTAEEVALLTSIADQVGATIESARLRAQAQAAAVLRERERLAQELHDSITQSLYSLVLFADWARKLGDAGQLDEMQARLTRIEEVSHQALKEMRLMLYELRPAQLENDGLARALQRRLDAVERRAGIQVTFSASIEHLPPSVELDLYRIAQEALNNAIKHAQANAVTLRIEQVTDHVTLTVRDDGVGFDPAAVADKSGLGLLSIRERTARLNGTLSLVSAPGSGTEITVSVKAN